MKLQCEDALMYEQTGDGMEPSCSSSVKAFREPIFSSVTASWKHLDEISESLNQLLFEVHLEGTFSPQVLDQLIELKGQECLAVDNVMLWLFVGLLDQAKIRRLRLAWKYLQRTRSVPVFHVEPMSLKRVPPLPIGKAIADPKAVSVPPLVGKAAMAPPLLGKAVTAPPLVGKAVTAPPLVGKAMVAPPMIGKAVAAPALVGKAVAPPLLVGKAVTAPPLIGKAATAPPLIGKATTAPPMIGKAMAAPPPVGKAATAPPIIGKTMTAPPIIGNAVSNGPNISIPISPLTIVGPFDVPALDSAGLELRKIHWSSIPVSRFKASLFAQLATVPSSLDVSLVREHFVKQICSEVVAPVVQAPTVASVLESKRVQQIEIFLTGNKGVNIGQIIRILQQGGQETGSIELLEALLNIYPTSDEIEALAANSCVAKADQFLSDLTRIPQFKYAVSISLILLSIEDSLVELINYFTKFNAFVLAVTTEPAVLDLFKTIGSLVVFLGGKSVHGFALDQVPHLRKIHSFLDKRYSAMHCVVHCLDQQTVKRVCCCLKPIEELIDFDHAEMILRTAEVDKFVFELKHCKLKTSDFYAKVSVQIDQLVRNIEPQLSQLHALLHEGSAVRTLREYFAENDKKPVNEIFSNLKTIRHELATIAAKEPPGSANKSFASMSP